MFSFYIYFLFQAIKKKVNIRQIGILVITTALILGFSYNAFSYDLFNYIFDAKIVTYYHQDPYHHRALDYPKDPMLSFMQWTHRVYPYGPVWLGLSVPLSFIGVNIFLFTFFLFKFMIAGFYLGSVFLIYKINQRINPDYKVFNTVFFALNPLVIIESLVSSHNDIVMIFFALLGVYLYLAKKKILAVLAVIVSSQIKIPTIALLAPILLTFWPINLRLKINESRFIQLQILAMTGVLAYVLTRIEIQPWYFLWILPFIALIKPNKYAVALGIGLSVGLLMRYSVFLYFGNWGGIGLPLRNAFTIAAPVIAVSFIFLQTRLGKALRARR